MVKISRKKEIEFDISLLSLIGNKIKIIGSKNTNQIGKKGIIIFESANFLKLEENGKITSYLKKDLIFEMLYKGKPLNIDAGLLFSTLQTRIKKIK